MSRDDRGDAVEPGGRSGSDTGPNAEDAVDVASLPGGENPDINDLLTKLDALKDTVDDPHEREKVRQTISLVERMPGSEAFTRRITKYTTRDIAESFVGGILLSLPLLVEDGVFDIAEWFASALVGGVPVFLVANVLFVLVMTWGLLYYADFRDLQDESPILGFLPRRLVAVLVISLLVAVGTMTLWGRLFEGDPTTVEAIGRVTVIWAAAAFGAALGDILPGESTGQDVNQRLTESREAREPNDRRDD
ncbi:DUF2391 family protein [Halorubrum tibetense]|uniref:DUF2391 family protein n=1 Tax=Halorubrum tibetense TaxID=175631 RepID=A0ABD5SAT7_9EURY